MLEDTRKLEGSQLKLEKRLDLYRQRMDEIVRRLDVVEAFIRGDRNAVYLPTTVECIYLQFRITLEVIATASLTVNQNALDELTTVGRRKWHAGDILEAVETINPDYYYPKPTRLIKDSRVGRVEGYRGEWRDFKGDYLTREKFTTLYDISSKVIHSENPFDKSSYVKDTKKYRNLVNQAKKWHQRIINLLTHHYFKLVGEEKTLHLAHTVGEDRLFKISTFVQLENVNADSPDEELIRERSVKLTSLSQPRSEE